MFVKRGVFAVAIGIGSLLVCALVTVPMVATQAQMTPGALPIPDIATQRAYEQKLETFLSEHPGPVHDFPSDGSVASLNAFYAAEVAWWNSVPWEAVAGQWGCSFQSFQASFNPPDANGVISAGYGTIINCGNALSAAATEMASSAPQTKSAAIASDPSLIHSLSSNG